MENKISMKMIKEKFPEYVTGIEARLRRGAIEYGDASFMRPPDELLDELIQEVMDISGWAFILWTRLERMKLK